jgi:hypothetical protein
VKVCLDLGTNEDDRALVIAKEAARKEVAQPKPQGLALREPPIDRPPLRLDAVLTVELD